MESSQVATLVSPAGSVGSSPMPSAKASEALVVKHFALNDENRVRLPAEVLITPSLHSSVWPEQRPFKTMCAGSNPAGGMISACLRIMSTCGNTCWNDGEREKLKLLLG